MYVKTIHDTELYVTMYYFIDKKLLGLKSSPLNTVHFTEQNEDWEKQSSKLSFPLIYR